VVLHALPAVDRRGGSEARGMTGLSSNVPDGLVTLKWYDTDMLSLFDALSPSYMSLVTCGTVQPPSGQHPVSVTDTCHHAQFVAPVGESEL